MCGRVLNKKTERKKKHNSNAGCQSESNMFLKNHKKTKQDKQNKGSIKRKKKAKNKTKAPTNWEQWERETKSR